MSPLIIPGTGDWRHRFEFVDAAGAAEDISTTTPTLTLRRQAAEDVVVLTIGDGLSQTGPTNSFDVDVDRLAKLGWASGPWVGDVVLEWPDGYEDAAASMPILVRLFGAPADSGVSQIQRLADGTRIVRVSSGPPGTTAPMAGETLKGNNLLVTGPALDLTVSQARALLVLDNVENKSGAQIRAGLSGVEVTAALGFTPESVAAKGQAGGYAPLDGSGLIPSANLPAIAITDTFGVASQAAMLALAAQKGDIAIRSDENKAYVLSSNSPGTLADWLWLRTPNDLVLSVAGRTGVVTLNKADVGLGNADSSLTTVMTSSGSYTIPAWAKMLWIAAIGGGGGGGSGAAGDNTANRAGGGGGGAGGVSWEVFLVTELVNATLTVTIGAAGVGGASVTLGAGVAGTAGGDTTVADGATTILFAGGGAAGAGAPVGTQSATGGAGGIGNNVSNPGGASGATASNHVAGSSSVGEAPGSGAGGAPLPIAGTQTAGKVGGAGYVIGGGSRAGAAGTAGAAGATAGGNGGNGGAKGWDRGQGGGGGSGGSGTTAGGNGGAGGLPGGGGGGGGPTRNTFNSGAGGAGAGGSVYIMATG